MSNRMLKASLFVLVILLAALLHKFNIVYEIEAVPTGVDKNSPVVEALMAQLSVKDSSTVGCTESYDRRHYHYSAPKLRKMLATSRDSNRSIYTGIPFAYTGMRDSAPDGTGAWNDHKNIDVEHIVAAKEAHVSGLCHADRATRKAFANDPLNLTLSWNRNNRSKSDRDIAEWMPVRNRCWFVLTVISVKKKYGLSIDPAEEAVIRDLLLFCTNGNTSLPRDDVFAY